MDQFISIIIFSLPGLITYFWIQMFGINPVVKHTPTEMVGIVALLWAPTTFLTILTYNIGYLLFNSLFNLLGIDLSGLKLVYLISLLDLNKLSLNLIFLIYYLVLSVVFSFLTAYVWSKFLYKRIIEIINKVRLSRKVVKLSEHTTVWDSFFFKLEEEGQEEQLIIEMYKIDKPEPEYRLCGAVTRMSRPFEAERSIIIDYSKGWNEAHKHYKYPIKNIYVDTKSGVIINELDYKNPTVKE